MFLGGAIHQIAAIQYAKKKGYYTILCDYLKDNPGQLYSDEFHCVSTTDKKAILEVAKQTNIDGIIAYATEAATGTAAYVGNKLNLPSYEYETVLLLSNKHLFREFLKNNDFNYPKSKTYKSAIEAKKKIDEFHFPLMVKPVDSSGSRGISRIDYEEDLDKAFENALSESTKKMVIIEEYIEMNHDCMIGGDIVVIDGKINFFGVINGHRDIENNFYIPFGNSYPTLMGNEKIAQVRKEIQRVIDLLEIKVGVLNIDVLFDKNEKPYIIEINARNGGNMVSELLKTATGIDLIGLSVEMALNNKNLDLPETINYTCYSTYYLRSFKKGKLKSINYNDEIEKNIIDKVIYKEYGEEIEAFDGLDKVIGIVLLEYNNLDELKYKMDNMDKYIGIKMSS